MKKILVFSDLHANKQALMDITPLMKEVDLSIFCGDIVCYGRDIDYCIDFVLNNVDIVVLGNHDRMAITNESSEGQNPVIRESIRFTRSKLTTAQIEAISSLPKEVWYEDMYITHSIEDDYLRTENDFKRLCEICERKHNDAKYIFFGHTHEQVLYKCNNKTIVNPGSIAKGRRGFPRSYVLFNEEKITFVNLEAIS